MIPRLCSHTLGGLLFWGLLFLCPFVSAAPRALDQVVHHDWGPVSARWLDVSTNTRTRVLGPFVEHLESSDGDSFLAIRPLFSKWTQVASNRKHWDFLWPVATGWSDGVSTTWRFLTAMYRDWDVDDPESRYRFWVLPLYFQGRDAERNGYWALFPLGGTVRSFLVWDRVSFFLFPLYGTTTMGNINSSSFLWPFVSKTTGDRVDRFRIFPFYGRSTVEGRWQKTFVLWPFWNSVSFLPPGSGGGWILFPLTGHLKTAVQETWWAVPPLFRYTRGEPENRIFGPWPLFQKSTGDEVDRFHLWPFYGRKTYKGTRRAYALWPICWHEVRDTVDRRLERHTILPVLHSTAVYEKSGGVVDEDEPAHRRRFKLWPLFSYSRNGEASRIHVPDLNPSRGSHIEQNWASFWRVFRRERIGDDVDTELLWGLYRSVIRGETLRHRSLFPLADWGRDAEGGRFNLLKGLLGVESRGGNREFRVLYFLRFGGESAHD